MEDRLVVPRERLCIHSSLFAFPVSICCKHGIHTPVHPAIVDQKLYVHIALQAPLAYSSSFVEALHDSCNVMKSHTALKIATERPISIQSLMTPAMFIVSALVLPMSRKTDMLRPKAAAALLKKIGMSKFTCKESVRSGLLLGGFER